MSRGHSGNKHHPTPQGHIMSKKCALIKTDNVNWPFCLICWKPCSSCSETKLFCVYSINKPTCPEAFSHICSPFICQRYTSIVPLISLLSWLGRLCFQGGSTCHPHFTHTSIHMCKTCCAFRTHGNIQRGPKAWDCFPIHLNVRKHLIYIVSVLGIYQKACSILSSEWVRVLIIMLIISLIIKTMVHGFLCTRYQ